MTKHLSENISDQARQIEAALKEPFPVKLLHWRIGATNKKKVQRETGNNSARPTKGIALAFVNSRDVMKRLDDVLGIGNWTNTYPFEGCCELSVKIDGEWITKSNGAGKTDVEGEKGRFSDAFKRSATLFGVARYLYYLPNVWVDLDQYGKPVNTPTLPKWAIPKSIENGDKENGE